MGNWYLYSRQKLRVGNYVKGKYAIYPVKQEDTVFFNLKYDHYMGFYQALWRLEVEIDCIWEKRISLERFPYNCEEIVNIKFKKR